MMSYILTLVGVTGFYFVSNKKWWAWWINVGCQFIWLYYALSTRQYGFLFGVGVYGWVFVRNALRSTREHKEREHAKQLFLEKANEPTIVLPTYKIQTPLTLDECIFFHTGPKCDGPTCKYQRKIVDGNAS